MSGRLLPLLATAAPLLLLMVAPPNGVDADVDATRQPNTYGSDVVDATVEIIKAACIFSEDRQFLRRLAYIETHDGTAQGTYRPGYEGGIWKVDQDMFEATRSCPLVISSTCDVIRRQFGIDWTHVTWSDLRKPLYSGLAAALYLTVRLGHYGSTASFIPADLESQANVWSHYYHMGQPPTRNYTAYAEEATRYECTNKMDLAFILDSSGSISDPDFQLSLGFVAKVVEAMNVPDIVRVAGLIYADAPTIEFYFHTYSSKAATVSGITGIRRTTGGTATDLALNMARTLFTTPNGARPQESTKRVAVLVTDGQSNNMNLTAQAAARLRADGVTVFSVGVGGYNFVELSNVASEPKCTHVFTLSDFSVINSIVSEIQRSTCKATLALENGTFTATGTIHVTAKPNKVVSVNVTCGLAHVYMSYTNPLPNAALHSGSYTAWEGNPIYLTPDSTSQSRPMYITVEGVRNPETPAGRPTCTDSEYQVTLIDNTVRVMCCQDNNVCHVCTDDELRQDHRIREVVCNTREEFPNPCTQAALSDGRYLFAYPYDLTKFIRCDYQGNAYVTQCPNRMTFNPATLNCGFDTPGSTQQTRLPPGYANPCTPAHLQAQYFYFEYTPDRHLYIHCDLWGNAWLERCPVEEVWSQVDQTCEEANRPHGPVTTPAVFVSPCTPEAIAAGRLYFPYPCDHTRFIHCDVSGNYWVQFCPAGMFFDPSSFICLTTDSQQGSQHGCD